MQTTLLGLGIAIILTLVAALVGPHFVDWSNYRDQFESQATALAGAPVKIGGRIDVRLLPTPSVWLRDVELDQAQEGVHLRASGLSVSFALGPLLRGAWRASELRLDGADIGISRAADGHLVWPGRAAEIDPESLSIEKFVMADSRVVLSDAASGGQAVLEQFAFNGDARSLLGPIRGEGTFLSSRLPHSFRVSAGRASAEGDVKLRLAMDRAQEPLAFEAEGTLNLRNATPRFEGSVSIVRQGGVVLVDGRARASEPWRLSGKVKTGPAGGSVDQLELGYGPQDRALKLSGTAEVKLGDAPVLEAVLSARQLDLDKFVALPEAMRRLPAVALRNAATMAQSAPMPPIPMRVGIGIDNVTLGQAPIQNVRADFRSDASGWDIETLEFRAPGATHLRASGRLTTSAEGYAFKGPASIEAADPRLLTAWLEGGFAARDPAAAPFQASGDVTYTPTHFGVERLKAEVDRNPISGRLDYAWATPAQPRPRLEAEISAKDLDVDAAIKLVRTAMPGASLDFPSEVALALDIGHATMAGVQAADTKAKLRLDSSGLSLDQVSIGDLAGVSLAANGRIVGPWDAPRGAVTADVAGGNLEGLISLLARFAPEPAAWLRARAERLAPAKLHVSLAVERPPTSLEQEGVARLSVEGNAGPLRLTLSGEALGVASDWANARLRTEGRIDADDGRVLAAIAGVDGLFVPGSGAGSLRWLATGPLGGSLGVQGQWNTPGAELAANGTLSLGSEIISGARAEITASLADMTALRKAFGRPAGPVPVSFRARLSFDDDRLLFTGLVGKVADSAVSGRLSLTLGASPRIDGQIDADTIDATSLVSALAGNASAAASPPAPGKSAGWSAEPFGARFLDDLSGRIGLSAERAKLAPFDLSGAKAVLSLNPGEAALENIEATLAGGSLKASVSLQASELGTVAAGQFSLKDAEIVSLWPTETNVSGRVSLQLDAKGSGRSPAVLIGSLGGTGLISFDNLDIRGFSPDVFAAVTKAVDQRNEVAITVVKPAVDANLDQGRFTVPRAEGSLTLSAGQIRVGNLFLRSERADIATHAMLDLVRLSLDARLALLGPVDSEGPAWGRPEIDLTLRGGLDAPQRSVDVSALIGWLTLRAVDLQAKRLQDAEYARRRAEEAIKRSNEEAAARRATEDAAMPPPSSDDAAAAKREAEELLRSNPVARENPPPAAEAAPPLPPAVEVRPAPPVRRPVAPRANPQASAERQPPRPPPSAQPPRSVFDLLFPR